MRAAPMTDRYTAHDYDAAWQVWDNVDRRSVGGSFTEAGALAEAARLNALAPKRAKSVEAWGIVRDGEMMTLAFPKKPVALAEQPNVRIARVRITEISEDDSHG